jgi:DnaJ homolog subfamily C member 7
MQSCQKLFALASAAELCDLQFYTRALLLDSDDIAVLGNRCAAALMLKRYTDAKHDAAAILEKDSNHVKAMSRLAKACLGTGDVDGAVRWAEKALEHDPAVSQLGTDLTKIRRVQQELRRAMQHLGAGNAAAAEVAARRARALYADVAMPEVEAAFARALLLQGRCVEALHASRSALSGDGTNSVAVLVHIEALIATGNISRALAICQSAMRSDPDNRPLAKAFKLAKALDGGKDKGNAAFKLGEYQAAYDAYSTSLEAGRGLQNVFLAQVATNRANACLKLQRYDQAIEDATLAIKADAAFPKAYLRRAQAFELRGEWDEAIRDLTKAHELDEDMPGIADKLKQAKAALKKSKRVDYYKLLEVDQDASDAAIKKAYKRAALKYHPDKAGEGEREAAEKHFKLLVEANQILTDGTKRRKYDAGWSCEEIDQGFQEGQASRNGVFQGMDMEDLFFAAMFQQAGRRGGFAHM